MRVRVGVRWVLGLGLGPCARTTCFRASREGSLAPLAATMAACLLKLSASCRLAERLGLGVGVGLGLGSG